MGLFGWYVRQSRTERPLVGAEQYWLRWMEEEGDSFFSYDFLKNMPTFKGKQYYSMCVFWNDPTLTLPRCDLNSGFMDWLAEMPATSKVITKKIQSALTFLRFDLSKPTVIQFWAPIAIEGGGSEMSRAL